MVVAGDPLLFCGRTCYRGTDGGSYFGKIDCSWGKKSYPFWLVRGNFENLQVGDILVPDEALSGEGTSRYYSSDAEAGPDSNLSAPASEGSLLKITVYLSTGLCLVN